MCVHLNTWNWNKMKTNTKSGSRTIQTNTWHRDNLFFTSIVPFHNDCSPSGELEQPGQRMTIFHKYCCFTKHEVLQQIWPCQKLWDILLICQNTSMRVWGAWIRRCYVLSSQTYAAPSFSVYAASNEFNSQMIHDDVIKSKHFSRYRPFERSSLNSPQTGQWRGALMFFLTGAWTNGWVNNREADDLRRHCAHYDVIVM